MAGRIPLLGTPAVSRVRASVSGCGTVQTSFGDAFGCDGFES
jgi:hypothetical protein